MQNFFSLIRFIFTTVLLLIGAALVVVLLNRVFFTQPDDKTELLIINPEAVGGLSLLNTNTRSLYNSLINRVDEINTPPTDEATVYYFPVESGETAQSVAQRLQDNGFITDANLFLQLLQFNRLDTLVQAGDYYLRRNMTMRQIGTALFRGQSELQTVMVPPGWRLEQLADYLDRAGLMSGEQFLQTARQGTIINHPLLNSRPAGQSYEGYLFPGSYLLTRQPHPADLILQMLNKMARDLPANTAQLAQQQGLNFHQVLILASIVEREAALDRERPIIASVYLNRLRPENNLPYLQADPTVQYALGYQPKTGQWWKSPIQLEEYAEIDSPYNTYLYTGLPPGPIASPGLDSILAVLQPAQTDYLFFVCRNPGCEGGEHIFSVSYEEHWQNVQNYWGETP